jgi:hypothetical protein
MMDVLKGKDNWIGGWRKCGFKVWEKNDDKIGELAFGNDDEIITGE